MKVLIISGIFPPDIGGPATFVPAVARGLAERGHAIQVITLSDSLNHDDRCCPFSVVRLPRKLWRPARWLWTITTIIRLGYKSDVLFVNELALESVLANRFLRKPMVQKVVGDFVWERATTYCHTQDDLDRFQRKRYGLRIEALRMLRNWWIRQADDIIVASQYFSGYVCRWGVPQDKIHVIPNALDVHLPAAPTKVLEEMPTRVIFVGRLIPLKRVDGIVEAVSQIENVGLVIVGDGPERTRLESLAHHLGINRRVHFAGQQGKDSVLAFMQGCDIFALNSLYETFSHVALEAMSLGLPVIAPAVGGLCEVVKNGETGFLVPADDRQTYVEALRRLVQDISLRQKLGEAARVWVRQEFSFDVMLAKVERLLYSAATPKNSKNITR